MKKKNKLWGFRTNKLWKKFIASLYYLFCLVLIIFSVTQTPEINANNYDINIYKISNILISISCLIPLIFISDFKFKNKIPLLKIKKWWSDILGFIIIFGLVVCTGNIVNSFHSNDYKNNYQNYNEVENNIPEDNNTKPTINENNNNLERDNKLLTDKIKVHYIDVGQGDAIFIELPNNQTMLIDAGEAVKGKVVADYIKKLNYSKIDYLVGTHPHADHIGGLAYIINNFNIQKIYMPKANSTSKTYENLLNTISKKELKVTTAKAGVNIIDNDNLKIDILAPNKNSYKNLNNYSAVIKINYGSNSFLFMGDAEAISENEILTDVSADVIKIGHHGSDSSSGKSFVSKVKAKYGIVMVGKDNKYNHPFKEIINRWENIGTIIYRTDKNGNITITSDGNKLEIIPEK